MIQIGSFQAKTHFSDILRQVEKGEEFCITNRGRIVAILSAPESVHKKKKLEAFSKLLSLRKKHPVGSVKEVLLWKEEGRQ